MNWRERATLHHGDYRETLALCEGAADLVLTSPPYVDARDYGAGVSWGLADYAALGDAVFTALRPGGWALINVDARVNEWRPGMGSERGLHPWRILLDYADRVGFRVPDRLAFGRLGTPGEYAGRFRNDWEPLLWFQRPGGGGRHGSTRNLYRRRRRAGLTPESLHAMLRETGTASGRSRAGPPRTGSGGGARFGTTARLAKDTQGPPTSKLGATRHAGRTDSPRTSFGASARRTGSPAIRSWAGARR